MSKASRLALYVYLTLTLFGMSIGVLYFLLMRNDFLTQNPDIEPYFRPYVASAMITVVGTLALIKGQRWGFWVILTGLAGAFGIEIFSGFPWEKIIRIPLAALLLFLLMRWNKMI